MSIFVILKVSEALEMISSVTPLISLVPDLVSSSHMIVT